RKVYVAGALFPTIRVPMREIAQTPSRARTAADGTETARNPTLVVYDPSGAYTDPAMSIDARQGLPRARAEWNRSREDSEELGAESSNHSKTHHTDARLADRALPVGLKP